MMMKGNINNIYERLHGGEFDAPENEYGKTSYHGYGAERLIKEGVSVLDVGAGRTPWLANLKLEKNLSRATCTDISLIAINYQIDVFKLEAYQCDIVKMPFLNNEFDLVVCFDVLEHLEETRIKSAIDELLRIAKIEVILRIGIGSSVWGNTELHLTQKTEDEWFQVVSEFGNLKCDGPFLILYK
jgi:ubiquinone/menaquinone biosynthesis C-methylase UbiE